MTRLATLLFTLLPLTAAHFTILTPTPLGTDDENQADSPCGGYTASLDSTIDIHAGSEAFSVQTSHPQSNWLIRATLDGTAAGGWEQIYPIFQQSGIGAFCMPNVTVPASFVGKKGIIGLVGNGADGVLYGCIAANFINGTGTINSGTCTNASTVSISLVDDSTLTALLGTPSDTSSGDGHDHDDSAATGLAAPVTGVLGLAALAAGAMFAL